MIQEHQIKRCKEEFEHFITKTYYDKYVQKQKTVFELCQVRDPQQPPRKSTVIRNPKDKEQNLLIERNARQTEYASNVRDQRKDKDTQRVVDWYFKYSAHFAKMPKNLLFALS